MNFASTGLLADMWDTNGHMGGGWWIVMMIWMMLFWAAVVVGIVWLARGGAHDWRPGPRQETPLEILDRRFAEGGLSAEEYHERRAVITSGSHRHHSEPQEPAQL